MGHFGFGGLEVTPEKPPVGSNFADPSRSRGRKTVTGVKPTLSELLRDVKVHGMDKKRLVWKLQFGCVQKMKPMISYLQVSMEHISRYLTD